MTVTARERRLAKEEQQAMQTVLPLSKSGSTDMQDMVNLAASEGFALKKLVNGNYVLWCDPKGKAVDLRSNNHMWNAGDRFFRDCQGVASDILARLPSILSARGVEAPIADTEKLVALQELCAASSYEPVQLINGSWALRDKKTLGYVDLKVPAYKWTPENVHFRDCIIPDGNMSELSAAVNNVLGSLGVFAPMDIATENRRPEPVDLLRI